MTNLAIIMVLIHSFVHSFKKLQFSHQLNGDNDSPYIIWSFCGLNELIHIKVLRKESRRFFNAIIKIKFHIVKAMVVIQ